jgi:hypothetical protein
VDRAFWVVLSRLWTRWSDALAIVKPATVIAWHRRRFARFWAFRSRRHGRRPLSQEVVALIVRMAHDNPTWSRRRIAAEVAMLGIKVSKDTVARYIPRATPRPRTPPSTSWATFVRCTWRALSQSTVPTVTFQTLYLFIVLSLERAECCCT